MMVCNLGIPIRMHKYSYTQYTQIEIIYTYTHTQYTYNIHVTCVQCIGYISETLEAFVLYSSGGSMKLVDLLGFILMFEPRDLYQSIFPHCNHTEKTYFMCYISRISVFLDTHTYHKSHMV